MHEKTLVIGALVALLTVPFATPAGGQEEFATAGELRLMEGFPPPPDKRVDRSNALMTGPYNRWSYLNMRMLYPTADIRSAEYRVTLRREIDGGIEGLIVEKPGGGTVDVETYLRETYSDALVVIHGDRVVFERYLNGMNSDHPHQMMSVTKSFAGLLGLMAVAEGALDESDPVTAFAPELGQAGAFSAATFGQVLNMTNSMDFSEDYADPESGIVEYAGVLGLMEKVPGRSYAANIYDFLQTLGKDSDEHGFAFHYQTPKTDVVNWVTNRATGRSFQEDMYDKLWSKLGTAGETYVLLDANLTLFAGGGLNATPNNLARFAAMMVNRGWFDGRQVVPEDIVQTLSDGGSIEAFSNGPNSSGFMGNDDWSYRAQWWVRHTPGHEAFTALGIHGQFIYIDLDRNVAIVKQSSQPTSADNYFDTYNFNAFDAIIEHLIR